MLGCSHDFKLPHPLPGDTFSEMENLDHFLDRLFSGYLEKLLCCLSLIQVNLDEPSAIEFSTFLNSFPCK